jgi:type I restriction enzyme S subunit
MMSNVKIGDVCDILNGFAFKSANYVNNGIRVIRIANVQKGRIVDDAPEYYPLSAEESISNYILYDGDLLMSLTGNVGRVGILSSDLLPAALNQRVACVRVKDETKLDKRYLYYLFNDNHFEDQCILSSKGIAQKNMSTEWLKGYIIQLPSIERQRKIITTLDKASELIALRKKQLEELDALAESVFYDMFGDPVKNEKEWETISLSELGSFKNGLNYKQNATGCSSKILGITDFQQKKELSDMSKLNVIQINNNIGAEYYLKNEDIVFVRSNGSRELVGRNLIVYPNKEKVSFSGFCIRFRLESNSVLAKFLNEVLSNPAAKNSLFNQGRGCNINNVNQKMLADMQIITPPINLQTYFAAIIEKIESQKALVRKAMQESEYLFQRLMQDLFNPD